jgi:hypothetical protein
MSFDWNRQCSGKVALVRYKREWRVCFVETPDKHLTFVGIPYGGKTLKEATADAERMAWKNDFEFVGRLDKLALGEDDA